MNLVLDTNVIFSALISGGKTREVIIKGDLNFYIPEFFFSEMKNNYSLIREKTGMDDKKLKSLLSLLFEEIEITPRRRLGKKLFEARDLISEIDPDDAPFLALALELNADIWSDDKHLQKQDKVKVWETSELINYLKL